MTRRASRPIGLQVQSAQCATCIYKPASGFDIVEMERQIADRHMPGHFRGARLCHHAPNSGMNKAVCRGFWNRHKDDFDAGQLAQRLGLVTFVTIDRFKKKATTKRRTVARG